MGRAPHVLPVQGTPENLPVHINSHEPKLTSGWHGSMARAVALAGMSTLAADSPADPRHG